MRSAICGLYVDMQTLRPTTTDGSGAGFFVLLLVLFALSTVGASVIALSGVSG